MFWLPCLTESFLKSYNLEIRLSYVRPQNHPHTATCVSPALGPQIMVAHHICCHFQTMCFRRLQDYRALKYQWLFSTLHHAFAAFVTILNTRVQDSPSHKQRPPISLQSAVESNSNAESVVLCTWGGYRQTYIKTFCRILILLRYTCSTVPREKSLVKGSCLITFLVWFTGMCTALFYLCVLTISTCCVCMWLLSTAMEFWLKLLRC